MSYHISVNGKRIASFDTDIDRAICLNALREWWGEGGQQFVAEND